MSDQQREIARLMVMEQTFETEGWREIVRELENEVEVIKGQVLAADSWEDVKFLQGKAEQCWRMIYLADIVDNMKTTMVHGEAEDADV